MKKITLIVCCMLATYFARGQQIAVNPGGAPESTMTLEQLIEDVFLGSSCATVSNITSITYTNVEYSDAAFNPVTGQSSFAYFTHPGGNFPITRGIIMSNGAATAAAGPNNLDPLSGFQPAGAWAGDADMKTILDARFGDNQPTENATVVEFDFVPLDNNFSFDYVFASDEYVNGAAGGTDYECSTFQDGFAFILTGMGVVNDPGIGGKNIALFGGTPVSAGTIHNNTWQCAPAQNPAMFVNHAGGAAGASPIQYNGRTVRLTAAHAVVPGQTYHMKMVIADRTDNAYDSAVFIQASTPVTINVDLGPDRIVCEDDFPQVLTASGLFSGSETYTWEFNDVIIAGATSSTYNATQPGKYEVYVEDGNECDDDVMYINTTPNPTATVTSVSPICSGSNAVFTLNGTPNAEVTYSLSSGGGTQTIALDATGAATVTVNNPTANVTMNVTQVQTLATPINGGGTAATGGVNPANATGAILAAGTGATNANSARVNGANTTLTLTLGHTVPLGTVITLSIAKDNAAGAMTIGDGVNTLTFNTGTQDQLMHIPFVVGQATNTLTFTRTGGSVWIDGVSYAYTIPSCSTTLNLNETVVVNMTPDVNDLGDQVRCDSYTLPAITGTNLSGNQTYSTLPNGGGTTYNAGDVINYSATATYPLTLYIYDATGTTPNCTDQEDFQLTLNATPDITDLADQEHCDSYTLPAITGTNLTGNETYSTLPNGGGTTYNAGAVINYSATATYPLTIYIYDATGTTPNCTDEESFQLTLHVTPDVTDLANQEHCDSYTLPAITGTNLSGNETYSTLPNGGGTTYNAGDVINYSATATYPLTLYIYDETGSTPNCSDQEDFQLTLHATPVVDDLADQEHCDSYTLPAITGTNLTGNETYSTLPNGGGTTYNAGDVISYSASATYPLTIYIYDATGTTPNCTDQEDFQLTLHATPDITDLTDQAHCDSYTLPAITGTNLTGNETYSTLPNGGGTTYNAGDVINYSATATYPVTLYIYDATGTTPNCTDQEDFQLTLFQTPTVNGIADVDVCNFYDLPAITGTNLTGNEMYYTGAGGTGTSYAAGAQLVFADFPTYPVTMYIYDATGTSPNCSDEESFQLIIQDCNVSVAAATSHASICSADNTAVTLTATPTPAAAQGTYSYAWSVGGTPAGTGTSIVVNPTATTTYTVTLTDSGLTAPNNTATNTVTVTVVDSPDITDLADQEHCDSYTLPAITGTNLTGNETYSTLPNGGGTTYNAGDLINYSASATYPLTLYMYDETGTTPNCFDQEDFQLTLHATPAVDDLTDQAHCDSYALPAITGTNLTGNETYSTLPNGGGTTYNAGDVINYSATATYPVTLYIYDATGTTPNCSDQEDFQLTLFQTPTVNGIADVDVCNFYDLPAITGTNLTGNEMYYTGTGGTGTSYAAGTQLVLADFPTYPVTMYIYDATGTTPNCSDEESFQLIIQNCNVSVTAATSHASICSADNTAVTLTATPNPVTAIGTYSYAWSVGGTPVGTGSSIVVNPTATTTYTVLLTDSGLTPPNNTATNTVTVTVVDSPDITDLADQEHCDSYTLPAITGTNLTGNEIYSTLPNGAGTTYNAGDVISYNVSATYPLTLYMYDETGTTPNCFDQEDFQLTLHATPAIDDLVDQAHCDSYTLPAITGTNLSGNQTYCTLPNGGGTTYNAGDVINYNTATTYPLTLYIYDETGTTPNCSDQEDFQLTLYQTPTVDDQADQDVCNFYVLPAITGTNLTGNETYATASNGGGTTYNAGDTINFDPTATYPLTIYIYDATGTTPNCSDEESFQLIIQECLVSVVATTSHPSICSADNTAVTLTATPSPATAQGTYTYAWSVGGTPIGTGSSIVVNPTVTTTYTVLLTDSGLTPPSNTATNTVTVTVVDSPDITDLADQEHCDSYTLPAITGTNLTGNEAYSTLPNGGGTTYNAGDIINYSSAATYPLTYYIYDATGTTPNCSDEESFQLTLHATPAVDDLADQEHCDSYALPVISGTNITTNATYSTLPNGGGTTYNAGDTITFDTSVTYPLTLYIYDETGTTPNCSDEESFQLTLYGTPDVTDLTDQEHCDSYILPAITGTNLSGNQTYATAPNGGGTTYNAGDTITFDSSVTYPITLYIYDETGTTPNCSDEETFLLTLNQTPDVLPVADQTVCDGYVLPTIAGNNLTGNEMYYTGTGGTGTAYAAGASLTTADIGSSATIYIYDATGTTPNCSDEESFQLTINMTPDIATMSDQVVCESFVLPAVIGTNLSGNEQYYTGPNGTGTAYAAGATINYNDMLFPVTLYCYDETGSTPNCSDEETFELNIIPNPTVTVAPDIELCDDDLDTFMVFNLTQNSTALIGGQVGVSVSYYTSQASADAGGVAGQITNPDAYTNQTPTETIYVRLENDDHGCSSTTTFDIIVNTVTSNTPDPLLECEQDNDGFTTFTLANAIAQITGNNPALVVTFYETPENAEAGINVINDASNPTGVYDNVVQYSQQIYIRVEDPSTGCHYVGTELTLQVIDKPELSLDALEYEVCDTYNTQTDGIMIFNLTQYSNDLLANALPPISDYSVTYYEGVDGNGDPINMITNPTGFVNTTNPQIIYASVMSITTGCTALQEIHLTVNESPDANHHTITLCDDGYWNEMDGIHVFDLEAAKPHISNDPGVEITFHETGVDADNDTNAITNTTAYQNSIAAQSIFARVEDLVTGCYIRVIVTLRVEPNPTPLTPEAIANDLGPLESCTNDGNGLGTLQQGYALFDLTTYEIAILTGEGPDVEPNVDATYHISYDEAVLNQNAIPNETAFYNTTGFDQTIYVRLTNENTGCYNVVWFDLHVPLPSIEISGRNVICVDEMGVPLATQPLPLLTAEVGPENANMYTYQWYANGVAIPNATDQTYVATQEGTYSVTVNSISDHECENYGEHTVTAVGPADITLDVTTEAFQRPHQIVANATSTVPGTQFLYSLDGGEYGTSGTFDNVGLGAHTITVVDTENCNTATGEAFIIDYPDFFSPNGDGVNDTWMIQGIDLIPISQIYIFDRYGKLLKQLDPDGIGWDGNYNGHKMPATDYWFKIIYIEGITNPQQKEYRGHFSLKR